MLRRLRTVILVLVAAALGAVLGRLVLQARERVEAGESPTDIDFGRVNVRIQDVIPGLVAAFRVKDAPWSWFKIPSWLAAFAVNFGVGAAGGDITSLRERAERAAFEAVGLDAREFGMGGDGDHSDRDVEDAPPAAEPPERTGDGNGAGRTSWATPPSPPSPPSDAV